MPDPSRDQDRIIRLPDVPDPSPTMADKIATSKVAALVVPSLLGGFCGLAFGPIALLGGAVGTVLCAQRFRNWLIERRLQSGQFDRANWLLENLDGVAWSATDPRQMTTVRIISAFCDMGNGNSSSAKVKLRVDDEGQLTTEARRIRFLTQLSLWASDGDSESIETFFDQTSPMDYPQGVQFVVQYFRGWVAIWNEDPAALRLAIARLREFPPPAGDGGAENHLAGVGATELHNDPATGVILLQQAVREIMRSGRTPCDIIMDLVFARLKRGDDPSTCLAQLAEIDRWTSHISPSTLCEYHCARAHCFVAMGAMERARVDLDVAHTLPASKLIRRRIAAGIAALR